MPTLRLTRLLSLAVLLLAAGCAVTIDHTDVFTHGGRHVPVSEVRLPAEVDRAMVHAVAIRFDGRQFLGYRVASARPSKAVIFFPGNGYGASAALARLIPVFHDSQTDLYVLSYAQPEESAPLVGQAFAMAGQLAGLASADSGVAKERIVAVGHSLGGWIALQLAGTQAIGCAVVVGTGTTAVATADRLLPRPITIAVSLRPTADVAMLDNIEQARRARVPTLVVGSEADEVMPASAARAIYENLGRASGGRMFVSPSAKHADYFRDAGVTNAIRAFMREQCGA